MERPGVFDERRMNRLPTRRDQAPEHGAQTFVRSRRLKGRFIMRSFTAAALALALSAAVMPPPVAAQGSQPAVSRGVSRVVIGPWAVIGWIAPSGTGYCSAERDVGEARVAFVRFQQGYGLIVRSPAFKLETGGNYPVRFTVAFVTNSTGQAQVLAPNMILVPLMNDPATMRRIAAAPEFEVVAADTRFVVPLDQFDEALTALENCLAERLREQPKPLPPAPPPAPSAAPIAPAQPPGNIPTTKVQMSGLVENRLPVAS
jgi:hypothetical protein